MTFRRVWPTDCEPRARGRCGGVTASTLVPNRGRWKEEEKAPHPTPENKWIGVQKLLLEAALKKGLTFFKKTLTFFKKTLTFFKKH